MDSEGSGAVAPHTLMGCRVTTCVSVFEGHVCGCTISVMVHLLKRPVYIPISIYYVCECMVSALQSSIQSYKP